MKASRRFSFPCSYTFRVTVTSKPDWFEPDTVRTEPRGA